jgi:hypothetical protein
MFKEDFFVMKRQSWFLLLASTLVVSVVSVNRDNSVMAQQTGFDSQKCIQGFVKQGLSNESARIWCNYKQECLKQSQKEGLPAAASETVCNCVINDFRKRYNPVEFKKLTEQAQTNRSVAQKLREVGEACFEEVLYED